MPDICNWCNSNSLLYEDKEILDYDEIVGRLLAQEVLGINTAWWDEDDPDRIVLFVNCNDIFAWACADAEDIELKDVRELYDYWLEDPTWGPAKWCCIHRNEKPQRPVIDMMKKEGSWDDTMEALPPNNYDKIMRQVQDPHTKLMEWLKGLFLPNRK